MGGVREVLQNDVNPAEDTPEEKPVLGSCAQLRALARAEFTLPLISAQVRELRAFSHSTSLGSGSIFTTILGCFFDAGAQFVFWGTLIFLSSLGDWFFPQAGAAKKDTFYFGHLRC